MAGSIEGAGLSEGTVPLTRKEDYGAHEHERGMPAL